MQPREMVVERDNGRCWICGGLVVEGLPPEHDLALTLDHIRPQSEGGRWKLSNLALAHRKCNADRHKEN